MRYVAAYLLAALGGKENPTSADIEKILSSVGIEADSERLKKVISELNGKNIESLIAAGREKLASMPVGGAAAPAAAAAAGGGGAAAAAAPEKEEKKPEKKEESESDDDDMGFGLFD
ncbi:60S acidic ribosomal protein P2 [Schistocerca americana]|uniref:60S acidic ribosomal protein P2 n=1 Tax=Schistocerca americana TaxID=7009 RepID=UPI001F4F1101|nr:60S acidic ribosomal protein P2 [Schistocerca americana]XP_047098284.1 60S acidic ribosomal protein P2 [Schistocerca piceifrons]XP_049767523.1 60S acidic ribosomal protein P2-like [Schistocerca cancellata]XP_049794113.1 60S acidic ribosomal protein P2 [Schistocerca nitens]XP_049941179.1 60S acidic ribosomal protein P2 [Schistocerca serialis cubense]